MINSWSARQIATAGAESDGVERLVASKRVKLNMRESADLSEGEEASESISRILPRDVGTANGRNMLSRFVTRIATPSAKADTFRSENLLPPVQIQEEDPANVSRKIASSRRGDAKIYVSHKWGH